MCCGITVPTRPSASLMVDAGPPPSPRQMTSHMTGSNGLPIWNAQARVDDNNLHHSPGGGNVRILSERPRLDGGRGGGGPP